MKKITVVLSLTMLFASASAQDIVKEPSDTIVLISGRKVPVMVQGVSPTKISYLIEGNTEIKEVERRQVHKILYRNGRAESFSSMAMQMVAEGDWKTVILTDKQEDIEGFFALGEAEAQSSPRSRNAKSAQQSADIRLKKRAVNMGGIVVFITNRESKGGYGEVPTHKVTGIVYGFDPPAE